MGKLLILLLVISGLGFLVYWKYFHQSPAYLCYLQWDAAADKGDCAALYGLTDGKAKEWVDDYCTPGGGMIVFGRTFGDRSPAQMTVEMKSTPAGSGLKYKYDLKSEETGPDGSVDLVVIQSLAGPRTFLTFNTPDEKQEVKLQRKEGIWKVIGFKAQAMP